MAKCLRCGAGPEWLQGDIPREAEGKADLVAARLAALEEAALEAFNVIQLSGGGGVAVGILVADRIRALKARQGQNA